LPPTDRPISESSRPWDRPPRPGLWARLGGTILFYTRLPLPPGWNPSFAGIAGLAPVLGAALGGGLGLIDWGLQGSGWSALLRSALVVGLWLWLTGGLHLDGAMDTADGLAVMDPQRRLAVMADSRTGAFGTMTAIAILGLKTLALADLATGRGWVLAAAALWGRWGQVVAIARYPYLKAEGKGALHKADLRLPQDLSVGLGLGLVLCLGWAVTSPAQIPLAVGLSLGGMAGAMGWAAWFNYRLGGHTGDTYGATVEWTETGLLCWAVFLSGWLG
jgi:adenosylcobinamide-GDP ribazoletransferase